MAAFTPKPPADDFGLNPAVTAFVQMRTLQRLLRRVETEAKRGKMPVVEVDLDLCGLMPVFRTCEALRITGREFGIAEFIQPEALRMLPGYSDEAWLSFLELTSLESSYRDLPWREGGRPTRAAGTPFGRFHELYWTTAWLAEDAPTPGLGAFVHRVSELGGQVVFISGRWLFEQAAGTRTSLRRAGISDPLLVIGNPWHEALRGAGEHVLSDAQIKAHHQEMVCKHGEPVAVVDDRRTNREAVIAVLGSHVLSLAIAIPGFTCDGASMETPWRISTFETFDYVDGQVPSRPLMAKRYPDLGIGWPWHGLYEGLGKNALPYVLPRSVSRTPQSLAFPDDPLPYTEIVAAHLSGTLEEEIFLTKCRETIPATDRIRLESALEEAARWAHAGLAAPFPDTDEQRRALSMGLIAAWLHSRDIEFMMRALGFPLRATGVHDLEEYVSGSEVIAFMQAKRDGGANYSPWLLRWLETIRPGERVNVGFLNPALLVSGLQWTPQTKHQEAMDVHRASDHHDGDGAERYDPLEAAINNLLHQREGRLGLRKEAVETWDELEALVKSETGAESLGKNSVGRLALRDAVQIARLLETRGAITPWRLVK